jgi:hypothetical protein
MPVLMPKPTHMPRLGWHAEDQGKGLRLKLKLTHMPRLGWYAKSDAESDCQRLFCVKTRAKSTEYIGLNLIHWHAKDHGKG